MNVLRSERFAAALLLVAAVLGLVIANLPFGPAAVDLKNAHLEIPWLGLDLSTGHWVSDGLLAIFFFIVAVELKRELVIGELNSLSKALLPAIAAVGGVVVPAGIFVAFTVGTDTVDGWPIPTATDIAFALGVLAVFGRFLPTRVRVFLLALAVLDDLIAILIIAFFFTTDADLAALGFARHRDHAVRHGLEAHEAAVELDPVAPAAVADHGAAHRARRARLVLRLPVGRARDDRRRRARPRDGPAPGRARGARARAVVERRHPSAVRVHRGDGAGAAGVAERARSGVLGHPRRPSGRQDRRHHRSPGSSAASSRARSRAPRPHVRRPRRRGRPRRHRLHRVAAHERARLRRAPRGVPTRAPSRCCSARASRSCCRRSFVTIRSRQYRRRGAAAGAGGGGAFAH